MIRKRYDKKDKDLHCLSGNDLCLYFVAIFVSSPGSCSSWYINQMKFGKLHPRENIKNLRQKYGVNSDLCLEDIFT